MADATPTLPTGRETRQECVTCGRTSIPGITVCTVQRYVGSETSYTLGSACDWRWITVFR